MHEHTFIEAILREIPSENKEKIKAVEIELGELAGIEAEHLKEHMAEKTSWEINISVKNSDVNCKCGYKGRAKIDQRLHDLVIFSCPECNKIAPEVIEGDKIKILKVVYEE